MKNTLFLTIFLLFWQINAQANEDYITKKSPYPVAKTLDRLENILKTKGITIFARVDHAAGARKVGKSLLPSQLLIFGNPKMGTPLINEVTLMGLELPMKALAWEDERGYVWLSYLRPSVLQQRHNIENKAVIEKMAKALDAITTQTTSIN